MYIKERQIDSHGLPDQYVLENVRFLVGQWSKPCRSIFSKESSNKHRRVWRAEVGYACSGGGQLRSEYGGGWMRLLPLGAFSGDTLPTLSVTNRCLSTSWKLVRGSGHGKAQTALIARLAAS